ncbi:glycosyltransferase family 8 protein [Candidatus Saccharibacteria bacterium]|nr:glycosyltransferase family 8 protein [Candidatus Saccharibacteria bacterium]
MSIFNTGINHLKKTKVVPIFLTITDDYAKYAAVAIHSLMKHTNPKRYYRVIVLYDKLSIPNRWRLRNLVTKNCAIQFHKMKYNLYLQIIMRYCATKTGSGDFFSAAVYYYRAFIARMFPMYEKAIYIDSDTVLLDDIGKLFDIDLGEYVLAARVDPKVSAIPQFKNYVENAVGIPAKEYVNSGVLLMNLKKLRKLHYITKMTDLIKEYDADLVAPDQDYLNVILRGKIMHLDSNWNLQPEKEMPKDAKLVHFNLFKKPWFYDDVDGGELFWNAARGTGFLGDLMRGKEKYTLKDMQMNEIQLKALLEKAEKLSKVKEPLLKTPPEE